ncbi:SDR family oxidoreductase [Muricauda sp. 2012CJ35-5]|uniref:SDR family oxidoreductase n=1 Tax=Flagellimonas spongiicola TaxID=2942208 RepID=A0ABT0PPK3_9FLAO|nr:SDR family oxidoreductase [Allomuricauda spongiicola]MCL6273325.1 SDR family oxidoreductase [Allomuricauda spongiicola]
MEKTRKWALILGGSSGLGWATACKLAKHNFNLVIIHRTRKSEMPGVEQKFGELKSFGAELISFNKDAINKEVRQTLISELKSNLKATGISVLVHSIAKGNLKPMLGDANESLAGMDFQITIEAMGISLYDWVKELSIQGLFAKDARVISFTSEGNSKAWPYYAAVSAAKVTLEAITRGIALEFAPHGIKANCIQAGVTDTKSLRYIPNSDLIIKEALRRNPNRRLTTPEDVANAAFLLTQDEANWITGTIIKVDGGESLQ